MLFIFWFSDSQPRILSPLILFVEDSSKASSGVTHASTTVWAEVAHLSEYWSVWTHSGRAHSGVGCAIAADADVVTYSLDRFTLIWNGGFSKDLPEGHDFLQWFIWMLWLRRLIFWACAIGKYQLLLGLHHSKRSLSASQPAVWARWSFLKEDMANSASSDFTIHGFNHGGFLCLLLFSSCVNSLIFLMKKLVNLPS